MHRRPPLLFLSLLTAAGCSGSSAGTPPPLNTVIGSAGGTLMIGNGEVLLSVPAGALRGDVRISVELGQVANLSGYVDVGPPYRFAPEDTEFALPAQLLLPYDPAQVSPAVDPSEVRIGFRDALGQLTAMTPLFADSGIAMLETPTLGTFWVCAPNVVGAASLFPLHDTDEYEYESGLVLTVARTSFETNIDPLETAKVTFTRDERTSGLYLDDRDGRLATLGQFEAPDWQEVYASPQLLIGERDAVGTIRPVVGTYTGYVPLGMSLVAYQGQSETTTEIGSRERITVPAGTFHAVHVTIATAFASTTPAQGECPLEFWFADGVGPVAIRSPESPAIDGLVTATVNGVPVGGGG